MTQHLSEVVKLLAINYYKNNDNRKILNKVSTRRRKPKNYIK